MGVPTNVILIALSFIGVGSLAYLLFSKDNENDTYSIKSQNVSVSEVDVPLDCVPIVIGRQGSNIKGIELESGARLHFEDASSRGETRKCRIRGSEEAIAIATAAIHTIIANQPLIQTFEMLVPAVACGRIIGRNGETIRNISFNSNAKITVARDDHAPGQRKIVIKGTDEQISMARSLLSAKVTEELEYQSRMEKSVGSRSPRHAPKYLLAGPAETDSQLPARERLLPTGSDGLLEVYASAIESADRLWLQVKGPSTVELDRLNESMTEYYAKVDHQDIYTLTEVRVGQLVAAPFMYDNKYYRAEVSDIRETEEGQHELDLYYVDYGDSGACLQTHAFDLRTDYLKLRFQAIECILARVKPKDGCWSDAATDLLEELTHVALWKPLTARVNGYKERPTRAKREGSPVPCVDLYDTSGPTEIDVANELVSRGFAEWNIETEVSDSSTSLKAVQAGCEESEDEAIDLMDE